MSARTAVVAALAAAAFVVLPTHPTFAAFSAAGTGTGLTTSASIPPSVAPTAVVSGRDVTVSWPTTTLSSGTPAEAYTVRRYDTSNAAQTVLADCIARPRPAVSNTTCLQNWVYTVQPRTASWTGGRARRVPPSPSQPRPSCSTPRLRSRRCRPASPARSATTSSAKPSRSTSTRRPGRH